MSQGGDRGLTNVSPESFDPWQVQPPQETKSRISRSISPSPTVVAARLWKDYGRCNVGDRILREGTNQQIRVLNLNRRPNINLRPVSSYRRRCCRRRRFLPLLVCLFRVHGFLSLSLTRSSSVLRYNQCRTTDTPDLWHRMAPKRYLRATFGETKQRGASCHGRYIFRINFDRI